MFITLASVIGIAGGINSLTGGGITNALGLTGGQSPQQTQASADPFSAYRGGMAQEYASIMAPGGTVNPTQLPGYSQFVSGVLNPAMQAVEGQDAASGRAMSGQEQQDLSTVASQNYYGYMQNYMNQLAQGSGAINNPATGAQLGYQQQQSNQQGVMQGLGGVMQGFAGLSGSGTNVSSTGAAVNVDGSTGGGTYTSYDSGSGVNLGSLSGYGGGV